MMIPRWSNAGQNWAKLWKPSNSCAPFSPNFRLVTCVRMHPFPFHPSDIFATPMKLVRFRCATLVARAYFRNTCFGKYCTLNLPQHAFGTVVKCVTRLIHVILGLAYFDSQTYRSCSCFADSNTVREEQNLAYRRAIP